MRISYDFNLDITADEAIAMVDTFVGLIHRFTGSLVVGDPDAPEPEPEPESEFDPELDDAFRHESGDNGPSGLI